MAESLAKEVCAKLSIKHDPKKTLAPLRQHSLFPTFKEMGLDKEKLRKVISTEKVRTVSDLWWRRLAQIRPPTEDEQGLMESLLSV